MSEQPKPMELQIEMKNNIVRLSLDGMPLRMVRDFKIEGSAGRGHYLTVTLLVRDVAGMEDYPGDFEIVPDKGYQPIDDGSGKIPPGDE